MYFAKGARGVEVIPNYVFWKDLPYLIKVQFTMHSLIFHELIIIVA